MWSSLLTTRFGFRKDDGRASALPLFFADNFFGVVEGCFCRGFCKKRGADGGFLMVNLWWNAGERW
jgi:hypothetical protein